MTMLTTAKRLQKCRVEATYLPPPSAFHFKDLHCPPKQPARDERRRGRWGGGCSTTFATTCAVGMSVQHRQAAEPTVMCALMLNLIKKSRCHRPIIRSMTSPTFEDACRRCDAANANGINFVSSFGALAAMCKDLGKETVASKAKDLLRVIVCSAPMCCSASRVKAVRSVAICVLESGPAAAGLLATGLIKGSSIYAHK